MPFLSHTSVGRVDQSFMPQAMVETITCLCSSTAAAQRWWTCARCAMGVRRQSDSIGPSRSESDPASSFSEVCRHATAHRRPMTGGAFLWGYGVALSTLAILVSRRKLLMLSIGAGSEKLPVAAHLVL
ncbi:hypothetical protein IF1G_01990 [Cordyceps javanica]|uniref:Uncharacterized protein n=1 Tax=Cordyceps javanica TaxID=43265 RepID=A0A545VDI2_9HYPO|nr:hypothetical protein IF1G_01990 [Cordyceps javanica]